MAMYAEDYQEYLKSPRWTGLSKRMRQIGYCEMCGANRKHLEVHHRYYQKDGQSILGRETYKDLIVLCPSCHEKIHRYLDECYSRDCGDLPLGLKMLESYEEYPELVKQVPKGYILLSWKKNNFHDGEWATGIFRRGEEHRIQPYFVISVNYMRDESTDKLSFDGVCERTWSADSIYDEEELEYLRFATPNEATFFLEQIEDVKEIIETEERI